MDFSVPKRKLSFSEIVLIPEALLLLSIFRLKVSYQHSKRWMPKATTEIAEDIGAKKMEKAVLIAKVINGLEARTPWENTCLTKALATRQMLQRRFVNPRIHFGVAPTLDNKFRAHAWLSVGDANILGSENLEEFYEISGFQ